MHHFQADPTLDALQLPCRSMASDFGDGNPKELKDNLKKTGQAAEFLSDSFFSGRPMASKCVVCMNTWLKGQKADQTAQTQVTTIFFKDAKVLVDSLESLPTGIQGQGQEEGTVH